MPDCIPYYEGAYTQKLTVHTAAAVLGCRMSAPLGPYQAGGSPGLSTGGEGGNLTTAGYATAAAANGGVFMYDAAIGKKVGVLRGKGTVAPIEASAAITENAEVEVSTTGRIVTFGSGVKVGRALKTAAGAASIIPVELY
jgi:hypothetical protein